MRVDKSTASRLAGTILCGLLAIGLGTFRSASGQYSEHFNYSTCAHTAVVACTSCFPILLAPVTCGDQGSTCACGLYKSMGSTTYSMCKQDASGENSCFEGNAAVGTCTGGGVYLCNCCENLGGTFTCVSGGCAGTCGGDPDYTNITAGMGGGCV